MYKPNIPIFPEPFKSTHNHVKYEMVDDGTFIFNRDARLKDMHVINVGVTGINGHITKHELKQWANKYINLHPQWTIEAQDARNI